MRKTFAEINISNLIFNYLNIQEKVGQGVLVMPVVKADAYGHGMPECVKGLLTANPKPEYFAVALLEEAIEFKKHFKENVLCFGRVEKEYFKYLYKYNITPTFWNSKDIEDFNNFCKANNYKGNFHLEIDTGMCRTGIKPDEIENILSLLKIFNNIFPEGVFTHFASSDSNNKTFANKQLDLFKDIKEKILRKFPDVKYFHSANSGAILDMPGSYFNMVRPGISLYGYYPSEETTESVQLKPVMSVFTKYSHLKWVEKSTSVSYSHTYFTKSKSQILTLPVGYADGYNRLLSNRAKVIINNNFYPVVGRVCMDYIMVNIGKDIISADSQIILMGCSKNKKFDALDMSKIIKTIPYEICTSVSKRIKKVYKY